MSFHPSDQPADALRIAVDEIACAQATGMSVAWLRKDRRTTRLLPFYRIGKSVRYNLGRVREALATLEEGGAPPSPSRAAKRSTARAAA